MERALEAIAQVRSGPEPVVGALSRNPARILTGLPSTDTKRFVAEMTVELGGGTSLLHEVDVVFERWSDEGAVGRFGISWSARDHRRAFPVFDGSLEVRAVGTGSQLRLAGHYSVPLGPVGAFGDGLVGHRIARRAVETFLEAAAARINATLTEEPAGSGVVPARAAASERTEKVLSQLYLG